MIMLEVGPFLWVLLDKSPALSGVFYKGRGFLKTTEYTVKLGPKVCKYRTCLGFFGATGLAGL